MQPLNNKKRIILLLGLVVMFLFLIPVIILNSLGYKWEESFSFIKTGGIYVHSDIPNANIYVNNKFIKNNNQFFRNFLLQELRPNQEYKIVFQREGYTTWTKNVYVYPELVSEARVMMLPEKIEKEEIYPFFNEEGEGVNSPVAGFTIISKTADGRIIPENEKYIDAVVLFEEKNPYEPQVSELIVSDSLSEKAEELPYYFTNLNIENPEELQNLIETNNEISWIHNGDIVMYWIDKFEKIPYYYCAGERERICNDEIFLDWQDEVKRFNYFPGRSDIWIVLTNNGVFAVEIDPRGDRNIQTIYEGSGLDFRVNSNGYVIVKDKGSYFRLEL